MNFYDADLAVTAVPPDARTVRSLGSGASRAPIGDHQSAVSSTRRGRTDAALAVFTACWPIAAALGPLWAGEPERAAACLPPRRSCCRNRPGIPPQVVRRPTECVDECRVHVLLAVLLLNAAWLATTALAIFVAVPFTADALRYSGLAVLR